MKRKLQLKKRVLGEIPSEELAGVAGGDPKKQPGRTFGCTRPHTCGIAESEGYCPTDEYTECNTDCPACPTQGHTCMWTCGC